MKKQGKKWSDTDVTVLMYLVDRQMKQNGYVDFKLMEEKFQRTADSCNSKACSLGLLFHKYKEKAPEKASKPKYDLIDLPNHKNNLFIDYWEGKPNPVRVNYPAVWEVLRRKKV
jgi:hypothetical protein